MNTNHIGLIGLGKMGRPLALNLRDKGYGVAVYDAAPALAQQLEGETGIRACHSPEELCRAVPSHTFWLMVPAGPAVDQVIEQLLPHVPQGAVFIDGGNSFYKDSIRRHEYLQAKGHHFLDCGTSGGISGARNGACTMIGGQPEVFARCEALFKAISVENGCLYCGAPGSGHFVKMVHNGIEYGMMQAIAEGFEVLHKSPFELDYKAVAQVWNHGSVVRGWLMELTQNAFAKEAQLESLRGVMHSSGEGRWTVESALEMGVATPVIALSLLMRYRSQEEDTFAGKVVAALRNEFGGHAVEKK